MKNVKMCNWPSSWKESYIINSYQNLHHKIVRCQALHLKIELQKSLCDGHSNELTTGPPKLVQHFCLQGKFKSAQERCMSQFWHGLAISLAYHSREEWGIFLVQMIFTPHKNGLFGAPM